MLAFFCDCVPRVKGGVKEGVVVGGFHQSCANRVCLFLIIPAYSLLVVFVCV